MWCVCLCSLADSECRNWKFSEAPQQGTTNAEPSSDSTEKQPYQESSLALRLGIKLLSWVLKGFRSSINLYLMSTSALLQLWGGALILGCVLGVRAAFLLPSSLGMRWEKSPCPMQVKDLLGSSGSWLADGTGVFIFFRSAASPAFSLSKSLWDLKKGPGT